MNVADIPWRWEGSPARWRRPFQSWMDGIEAGWAIPLLLLGFIMVWLAFLTIAYLNGDLDPDTLQAWSSGRSIEWGYAEQPPLAPWLARAWTSVFPLANWSFRLLDLTNAALALWAIDLISRRFVRGDRRMVVLLLLMLLPIYQFQAQHFDAASMLLVVWPLATYCFLRSFETRQIGWAIAAGAAAALVMLGKYQSVFLIVSFVVAAMLHPQRRAYLASRAPWVSAVTGYAVLSPHLYWLATTGAKPFAAALGQLASGASSASLIEALLVTLILALVVEIPLVIWGLMVPGTLKKLSQVFRVIDSGQLLLFLVSVGTIVFPAITAVGLGTDIVQAWEFQGLFLLVILIVCGASSPIERRHTVNLAALVTAIAVVSVVVAAPLHALYRNYNPLDKGRNFYQSSAAELTRQWHERSAEPLRVVGGDEALALAAAFYSPDHPVVEAGLVQGDAEGLPPETTLEQGWASLCFDGDAHCASSMEKVAARASRFARSEFAVQSNLSGLPGVEQRFAALIVPRSDSAPPPVAASPAAVADAPSVAPSSSVADAPSPSIADAPPAAASLSLADAPSAAASPPVEEQITPPPTTGLARGSSEDAAGGAQPNKPSPTCCVTGSNPDGAVSQSEDSLPVAAFPKEEDIGRGRRATLPLSYQADRAAGARAAAEYKVNWMRWAAARRAAGGCRTGAVASRWQNPCCSSCWSATRLAVARWQLVSSSARCASRRGCSSATRALASVATPSSGATTPSALCSRGDSSTTSPLLARLSQRLCELTVFFDAHAHNPQRRIPASVSLPRAHASTAQLQLLRGDDHAGWAEAAEFAPE
jgi:4-amino-4-deoxy-L-arabinose transferase-like glycosyltransferase